MLFVPPDCVKVAVPPRPTFSERAEICPLLLRLYVAAAAGVTGERKRSAAKIIRAAGLRKCARAGIAHVLRSCREQARAAEVVAAAVSRRCSRGKGWCWSFVPPDCVNVPAPE